MPKISVIVPIYNAENNIKRCIESVLNQDYFDFELLLIDDGSKDESLTIIQDYAQMDSRIKVISQKNQGVSCARNTGINLAIGDYITFLDSDDQYQPNYLSRMLEAINKTNADLVISGYKRIPNGEEITQATRIYNTVSEIEKDYVFLRETGLLNVPWNKLFRRSLITKPFLSNVSLGEDLLFVYDYLDNCNKLCFICDCLYLYTIPNGEGLTRRYHSNGFEIVKLIYQADSQFSDKFFDGRFSEKRLIWFRSGYLGCVHNLCISSNLPLLNQRRIYKNWISSELVKKCYRKHLFDNMGIYSFPIKSHLFMLVYLYWKLRTKMNKHPK